MVRNFLVKSRAEVDDSAGSRSVVTGGNRPSLASSCLSTS